MGRAHVVISLILLLVGGAAAAADAPRRVVFDQHFHWLTPDAAERTLQRIKRAGFNVFVPCVWIGRGTSWPSALAPPTPEWEQVRATAPDPLAHLIERAHALGIEVHPWFTVAYRTREFPRASYYDAGTPPNAFNVHDAEFQKFFIALVGEVAARYAVDGINLDYVRTTGLCVSAACAADYNERFKRDLRADRAAFDARPDAFGHYPVAWEALREWNRTALNTLVRGVSATVRRVRPQVVLSVDTIAEIREFRVQGADAVGWANNGWVDVIYHMDYGRELDAGPIDAARRRLAQPERLQLLLSAADWPGDRQGAAGAFSRDPARIVAQVRRQQSEWRQTGIALWTYRFLTDAQINALGAM